MAKLLQEFDGRSPSELNRQAQFRNHILLFVSHITAFPYISCPGQASPLSRAREVAWHIWVTVILRRAWSRLRLRKHHCRGSSWHFWHFWHFWHLGWVDLFDFVCIWSCPVSHDLTWFTWSFDFPLLISPLLFVNHQKLQLSWCFWLRRFCFWEVRV